MPRRGLLSAHDQLQEVLLVSGSPRPGHDRPHVHLSAGPLLQPPDRRLRLQVPRNENFKNVEPEIHRMLLRFVN